MGIETAVAVGLGGALIGGALNKKKGDKEAKQLNAYNQQQAQNFTGMMQQGPSALQLQGQQLLGGWQMPQAYSPQQIAANPVLSGGFTPDQVTAQQLLGGFNPTQVGAQQLNTNAYSPQNVLAQLVGAPDRVMAQQVGLPNYTPELANRNALLQGTGFNVGQDALMQALRTDPTAKSSQALQGIIGGQGNPFDTTELFRALGVLDQRNTDKAVADTRAGASGLGQRFGSTMTRLEGDMRLQANENAAARNAQIQMQSHGDAQQRMLAAIGQLSGNEQFGAQNQLALASQLQGAGLAAGQLGLGATQANNAAMAQLAGLQQQAALANQNASLQAALANQGTGLQAALANQGVGMQAALANQSAGLQGAQLSQQAALANQSTGLQAALANQSAGLQGAQLNQQAGLANQSAALQAALANQGAGLQGAQLDQQLALANQANQMQALLANQGAGLQAAGLNQQGMLAGQQGQAQILQMLLNAQLAQQGQNIQLAGLSAGVGAPVFNPVGWGDVLGAGSSALMQAYGTKLPANTGRI